jgi:hypothetical protein
LKCWKTCGFAVFHSISHPSEPSPHTIPVGHRPLPGVSADFRQGSFSGFGGRQEPHVICEFPVFLVRNAGFRRGGAQESLFSRMGTPLDFSHGGPTGGSPGARGRPRWARVAARWWAHFGPFVAHLTRFLYHSLRALGLDRLSHLQVCRVCRRDPFPQKHACSMLRVNGTYPTTVLRHALRPWPVLGALVAALRCPASRLQLSDGGCQPAMEAAGLVQLVSPTYSCNRPVCVHGQALARGRTAGFWPWRRGELLFTPRANLNRGR